MSSRLVGIESAELPIQAIRDKNVLIGAKDYAGNPVTSFRDIPIRVMDQLTITETRVT